jgi:hypothetical protein
MLQRTKYHKSDDYIKYNPNPTNSFQSSKYHHKKKSGATKKASNPWKKKNSSKNWNKENDQNYLNYDYYYIPKEKKEKNNYYNSARYNKYYQKNEKCENFEKNKNDKKMSFDNDATTQSNSSSHEHEHEEVYEDKNIINNNINKGIMNKSQEIANYKTNNQFQIIDINIGNNDSNIINNNNIIEKNSNNFNNIIFNGFKNLNLNSNQNIINNNINNINSNNKKKPKNQKKKKSISSELKKSFSDNISEPYNKFNSINSELISQSINPLVENTEILKIKVKIEKDKYLLFKLRRFDDLFLTVKLFCEINNINEKLMKPIITMVLCGLNSIYQIYNTQLEMDNIKILRMVRSYNDIDI